MRRADHPPLPNILFFTLSPGFRPSAAACPPGISSTAAALTGAIWRKLPARAPDVMAFTVPSAHWMAQEKPVEVNAGLARWLAAQFPELWVV